MTPSYLTIDYFINKFYRKEESSKGFRELSEERLSELSELIATKKDKTIDTLSPQENIEIYKKTLQYLTHPYIHFELETFDERLAYLILMVDPNLTIYKEFLKLNLISSIEITKVEDLEERKRLINLRNQTISTYKSTIRKKLGFFDSKLLKYEEVFFKRFLSNHKLITEVGSNNHNHLMLKAKTLKDFDSITDERYEELMNIAQGWLSLVPEQHNYKTASYNITNQKKLLGLTTSAEQLALFILLVDSNLDILKIYEEESMMKNIQERIIDQFGFFEPELLTLERKFHNRFCPDKELSIWTKTKKTLEN